MNFAVFATWAFIAVWGFVLLVGLASVAALIRHKRRPKSRQSP